MKTTLALAAALCLSLPAMAVNKCAGADGRAVFQDTPCADGRGETLVIRPASGHAPAMPVAPVPGVANGVAAPPQTEADRLRALAGRLRAGNRISTLEVRVIPDAHARIYVQKRQCDAKFAALQQRKGMANNNLAGATWEQSISSEMSAVAARCDTEQRVLSADLERFQRELVDLKGGAQPR